MHDLADWFRSCGVTNVAIELTGVYWVPAFQILKAHGFKVILVSASYAKNVPGCKTDVRDAEWLRQLHSYGLRRGSFHPEAKVATLCTNMRQRERLTEYAAAHIQRMQKALMEVTLQLHHVVSDITGATGMRIIRAIVGGERDPEALAAFQDVRCKPSLDTIKAALGIEVDFSLPAARVIRSLDRIIEWRGKPSTIRVDNGPEYISEKLRKWAGKHGVNMQHIQPGQPQQNAYIERYNRTARHEWLDQYIIESIEEAQDHATQWLWTYNNDRPNMGIGGITPAQKLKMAA